MAFDLVVPPALACEETRERFARRWRRLLLTVAAGVVVAATPVVAVAGEAPTLLPGEAPS